MKLVLNEVKGIGFRWLIFSFRGRIFGVCRGMFVGLGGGSSAWVFCLGFLLGALAWGFCLGRGARALTGIIFGRGLVSLQESKRGCNLLEGEAGFEVAGGAGLFEFAFEESVGEFGLAVSVGAMQIDCVADVRKLIREEFFGGYF
jgi:hypothetical protein